MASFNKVIILGNLCADPELKSIPSGTKVCDVSIAVNDKRKNAAGEWVEEATFVDVTFWSKTAEILAEYLHKGSPVLIEGRLKLDKWEKDGQKRSKLRVVCERMQMVGSKGDGGGQRREADSAPPRDPSEAPEPSGAETYDDNNLPF